MRADSRFIAFEYQISLVYAPPKARTPIYLLRPGETGARVKVLCNLATLLLGWWGLPLGPVRALSALITNTTGGLDFTDKVARTLYSEHPDLAGPTVGPDASL